MKLLLIAAVALTPLLAKDNEPAKRLNDAAAVFSEVMAAPDKGIPQDMLDHAHCIVIVPDLKTAPSSLVASTARAIFPAEIRAGAAGPRQAPSASKAAVSVSRSAALQPT